MRKVSSGKAERAKAVCYEELSVGIDVQEVALFLDYNACSPCLRTLPSKVPSS
jgi:hypothetical protein